MPAIPIPFNFFYAQSCSTDATRQFLGQLDITGFTDGSEGDTIDFILSSSSQGYSQTLSTVITNGVLTPAVEFINVPSAVDFRLQGILRDGAGGIAIVARSFGVNCPAPPTCSLVQTAPPVLTPTSGPGMADGTATFAVSATGDAVQLAVNGGPWQPLAALSGLAAGVYTYACRQVALPACTVAGSFTIVATVAACDLAIHSASITDTSAGLPNGRLDVAASSSRPLQYAVQRDGDQRTPWQDSGTFAGLSAGDYSVLAQDTQGCAMQIRRTIAPSVAPIRNTGYLLYAELEEYYPDNNQLTGRTAPNVPGNPHYVAPVYDPITCPPLPGTATPAPTDPTPVLTPVLSGTGTGLHNTTAPTPGTTAVVTGPAPAPTATSGTSPLINPLNSANPTQSVTTTISPL